MKDLSIFLIIIVLSIIVILTYPFFVSVENGNMRCSNIIGQTVKCRN